MLALKQGEQRPGVGVRLRVAGPELFAGHRVEFKRGLLVEELDLGHLAVGYEFDRVAEARLLAARGAGDERQPDEEEDQQKRGGPGEACEQRARDNDVADGFAGTAKPAERGFLEQIGHGRGRIVRHPGRRHVNEW